MRADEERGGLTSVAQDYLKVIWNAQEWAPEGVPQKVSTKMLADRIGVSASTASESIRKLAEQGLVDHEKYGAVTLTEAGRRAALAMVRRHRLLEAFLVNQLGYSWDEVHDEAEVLEHAVSDRLVARIDAKLGFHGATRTVTRSPRPTGTCSHRRRVSSGHATTETSGPWPASLIRIRRCCAISTRSDQSGFAAARCHAARIRRDGVGGDRIRRRRRVHRRTGQPGGTGDLGGGLTFRAQSAKSPLAMWVTWTSLLPA